MEGTDESRVCCRQLLVSNCKDEHTLCNGEEEAYRLGALTIKLERCPHNGCGAQFYTSPTLNLQHQDTVHCAILAYICGACRGIYVSEGAFVCHVILGHNGPAGFKRDMDIRHGWKCHTKVSYTY